jgi:hypothetical protein
VGPIRKLRIALPSGPSGAEPELRSAVVGVWLHDDVVLASDINNGLGIFRLR